MWNRILLSVGLILLVTGLAGMATAFLTPTKVVEAPRGPFAVVCLGRNLTPGIMQSDSSIRITPAVVTDDKTFSYRILPGELCKRIPAGAVMPRPAVPRPPTHSPESNKIDKDAPPDDPMSFSKNKYLEAIR